MFLSRDSMLNSDWLEFTASHVGRFAEMSVHLRRLRRHVRVVAAPQSSRADARRGRVVAAAGRRRDGNDDVSVEETDGRVERRRDDGGTNVRSAGEEATPTAERRAGHGPGGRGRHVWRHHDDDAVGASFRRRHATATRFGAAR